MQLSRTRAVETQLDARRHFTCHEARPESELHVEQNVELPAAQSRAQVPERAEAGPLVDDDKLDPINETHEARFGLADDPRYLRRWPRVLQRAQHRNDVARIADRRQSQNADAARRLDKGQHDGVRSMSGRWPLGSEVRRSPIAGGAMLYDASRAGNLTPAWFDPAYWESHGRLEGQARGRGRVYFIRSEHQRFVLRHYRRGGLVARISGDRYLWRGEEAARPFVEWKLLYHLHRAGLPVPAPIAARYQRDGLTYTGDIITERLAIVGSLAQCLCKGALSLVTWISIGRCIRRFHDLGVCHADLNAHNILLSEEAVYLVDFDRCRLRKPGLWCDGNLVRLRRSLEKVTYGLPEDRFSEADWYGLLDGYRQSGGGPAVEPGS